MVLNILLQLRRCYLQLPDSLSIRQITYTTNFKGLASKLIKLQIRYTGAAQCKRIPCVTHPWQDDDPLAVEAVVEEPVPLAPWTRLQNLHSCNNGASFNTLI